LVDFAMNGHNDVFMLTLLLASALAAAQRRTYAGAAWMGLSVAAKYTTVLVAPLLLIASSLDQVQVDVGPARWRQFLARPLAWRIGLGTLLVLAIPVAFYAPWFEGIGTLGPVLRWVTGPVLNNYW